ncbi:MAG: hypothetical protein L3J69_09985 [Desulfobacula sp.]|nr:hypothetical protein [Desulfobacula sp.]
MFKKYLKLLILVILIQFAGSALGRAGEYEQNIEIHGFLMGNFSGRINSPNSSGKEGGDLLLGEERLRLDIFGWAETIEASARVTVDLLHDAVIGEFDTDLREAYLDYTTQSFDFRLGRQVITWGVGDFLFVNDVFPKDWVSFFSGRPIEYLKVGVDAFRTRYSSTSVNIEFLVIPYFEPDNIPTSKRFYLFDPFSAVVSRYEDEPKTTFENTELALRFYRRIKEFDVSAYMYRGFFRTPGMRPDNLLSPNFITRFYPDLSVYGLSAQGSALDGILSFEAGYYHSRQDENGDDPFIPNSQIRYLIGYQRQIWEDFTLGVQYYAEIMEDYSNYQSTFPNGFPIQKKYRDTFTLYIEQLIMHQTLKFSLFAFYNPVDNDYLIQPKVFYKFLDNLSATLGANIFGGDKDTTSMGQFDKNDNVFVLVRYYF